MYSNSDFERLFLRYKSKSVTSQETMQTFCLGNKVPYNLFEKWYRDTRHKLVPVKVEGHPGFRACGLCGIRLFGILSRLFCGNSLYPGGTSCWLRPIS